MRAIAAAADLIKAIDHCREELIASGAYHMSILRASVELKEALSRLPQRLADSNEKRPTILFP